MEITGLERDHLLRTASKLLCQGYIDKKKKRPSRNTVTLTITEVVQYVIVPRQMSRYECVSRLTSNVFD